MTETECILLEDKTHDKIVDGLKTETEGIKLGYGANVGVQMGPDISIDVGIGAQFWAHD